MRARRWLLAGLLAVGSVGWVGEGNTVAASPAELISVDPASGTPLAMESFAPSVSGDGNIVVFSADAFVGSTLIQQVFVRNRSAATTTAVPLTTVPPLIAAADGVLSRDGCHVVFLGESPPSFIPSVWNVYTWNRCAAGSSPVLVATPALTGNFPSVSLAVSADGRYVAYIATPVSQPPRIAWVDTSTLLESVLVTTPSITRADSLDISDDGQFVAIAVVRVFGSVGADDVIGWTPPCSGTCTIETVSVGTGGQAGSGFSDNPSVSADGRFVAFRSNSPEFAGLAALPSPQLFVRDRLAGVTKFVTDTPGQPVAGGTVDVGGPDISPDGSQVALSETDFGETSNVWVARSASGFFDTSVFDLVSFDVNGAPLGGVGAGGASMSSTGRFVAFSSPNSVDLSGGAVPDSQSRVWMRARPIALDITPTINFGTVDVGSQSAPQNAVVTNTSVAVINISGVTPPTGPFVITANGCNGVLAAGASCAVTLVFRPSDAGGATSSVTVSGDGLSVSSSLVGTGRALPTAGSLTIAPASATFGSAPLGTTLPAQTFTVTNPGQTPVAVSSVTLNGSGSDQFAIVSNTCPPSLPSGGSCTVAVSATVSRVGSFSATVVVLGSGGTSATAILRVTGTAQTFNPTLKMNPGVVSAGEVTAAIGDGFPPNIDVKLAFENEPAFTTVHTKDDGSFRFDFLVLRNGVRIGGRQVVVIAPAQFSTVRAPLLIDLATFRPSGFSSPAFTSGVRSLVNRGG